MARFFPKVVYADWKCDRGSTHLRFVHAYEDFEQEKGSFDDTEPIKVPLPSSLRNRMPPEVSNAPQLVALTLNLNRQESWPKLVVLCCNLSGLPHWSQSVCKLLLVSLIPQMPFSGTCQDDETARGG